MILSVFIVLYATALRIDKGSQRMLGCTLLVILLLILMYYVYKT